MRVCVPFNDRSSQPCSVSRYRVTVGGFPLQIPTVLVEHSEDDDSLTSVFRDGLPAKHGGG
jgi:hypothetical protein